jgi:hypothetical protein
MKTEILRNPEIFMASEALTEINTDEDNIRIMNNI